MTSPSLSAPPRSARLRSLALQALALAAVAATLGWLARNAAENLAARQIAGGFGFLADAAGFAIAEGPVPYDIGDSYLLAFAAGIANTLRAAIPAVALASVLGLLIGIAQISRHPLISRVARVYVDLVRNVPLLVQVLMWYFLLTETLPDAGQPLSWGGVFLSKGGLALPAPESGLLGGIAAAAAGAAAVLGVGRVARRRGQGPAARAGWRWGAGIVAVAALWWWLPLQWQVPRRGSFGVEGGAVLSPEWLALVAALSLYGAAYAAEIVRAGLQAVPRGQWEAAHALGLRWSQALVRVVLPQGLRVMAPPYTSLVMNTVKNSSLAVAVGYPDVVSVATTALNQNGQAIECIGIIAAVYLLLNLLTAAVMALVNARVQIPER
ncbi:amino acid ABC transporter permease [Aquabacterium humicola]|uniref:amino acid ABC transporter permease n=1 Tax=Aquabacterium humicola TaxID=3237377 RepID=UPI002543C52C|nr:ABC transporter permease subunit [Rubrivivax pictus]